MRAHWYFALTSPGCSGGHGFELSRLLGVDDQDRNRALVQNEMADAADQRRADSATAA
jgi:hypothetical protein